MDSPEVYEVKEEYAGHVRWLLDRVTKSRLAAELNIQNTQTLDQWTARSQVPVKYHEKIREMVEAFE